MSKKIFVVTAVLVTIVGVVGYVRGKSDRIACSLDI